jgi:tRNA pseudouridine38-40 synthase
MKRYAICVGYLPTLDYSGFSNQLHDPQNIFTVVYHALKKARLIVPKSDPKINYASRTDRGVGALCQVVAINTQQPPILSEINSHLPDLIRALSFVKVEADFHPRRDAQLRTYSYFLTVDEKFDLSLARKTLEMLLGSHDFHNFAKKDPTKNINTVKEVKTADIIVISDDIYQIRLASKSFLWQQIRRIISHLVEVSTGLYDLEYTQRLLSPKPITSKPAAAPPENLILEDIEYPTFNFQYDQKALRSFGSIMKKQLIDAKTKSALYDFINNNLQDKMG